jgi:cytochrome c oxidase assembly factor CtaG
VVWFAAAIVMLVVALASPLAVLSEQLFLAHMTQHLLLAAVVPPLLLLGAPERTLLHALPRSLRRSVVTRSRSLHRMWDIATAPLIAWTLHTTAVWVWHAPPLFDATLGNDIAHAAEHSSFLGTGILLWWSILHPPRGRLTDLTVQRNRRRGYALGIATLFTTAMQSGALGALLALSHRTLYAAQSVGAARWGLTALEDQHLAGMVMWVPGGILYVIAMCALFVAWLTPPTRRRAMLAVGVAGAAGIAGCQHAEATAVPGGDIGRGKEAIEAMGCGACHVISGIRSARGEVGPPLAGVARRAIIGGVLPNTPDNMMAWIQDPPAFAPRTTMPNLGVTPQEARNIAAYLYTLK